MSILVERFTGPIADHGEGPVWDPAWGGLRFVDMLAGDIVCLDAGGSEVDRIHVGDVAAAFRPRRSGGLVVAVERGFALVDDDGRVETLPELWSDDGVRMNEGGCDPQGRFYCGSMADDLAPGAGDLWRLDPDGSVALAIPGVTVSNGLAWSPDTERAYYIDSATCRIDVFDHDVVQGPVERRPLVSVREQPGTPDGMTVDTEGGLWVAFFGGARICRYQPDGRLEAVVELPVRQVTACIFGGPALDELYITTSRQGAEDGGRAQAGSVYVAYPGVTGLPVQPFAG